MEATTGNLAGQSQVQREWLTYREAETFAGLSRVTLWKAIEAGEIQAARVGRAVRINRKSLDDYMRSLTV